MLGGQSIGGRRICLDIEFEVDAAVREAFEMGELPRAPPCQTQWALVDQDRFTQRNLRHGYLHLLRRQRPRTANVRCKRCYTSPSCCERSRTASVSPGRNSSLPPASVAMRSYIAADSYIVYPPSWLLRYAISIWSARRLPS